MKDFYKAGADETKRARILEQARDAAAKRSEDKEKERADIYVKYIEKIVEKGDAFIDGELLRVEKLSASKVSDKKKEQLRDRARRLCRGAESSHNGAGDVGRTQAQPVVAVCVCVRGCVYMCASVHVCVGVCCLGVHRATPPGHSC